jgi:hypothetical protein
MGLGTELETSCRTGPPAYMYCSLHGGRVGDNPIPTCFLSPIDCSKIPAQEVKKASFNKFCTCSYFLVSDITVLAKIVLLVAQGFLLPLALSLVCHILCIYSL